jgi:hypothetical protein
LRESLYSMFKVRLLLMLYPAFNHLHFPAIQSPVPTLQLFLSDDSALQTRA